MVERLVGSTEREGEEVVGLDEAEVSNCACFLADALVCQPHEHGLFSERLKKDPCRHFLIEAIAAKTSLFDGFWPRTRAVPPQGPSTGRHTFRCHGNGVMSTFHKASSKTEAEMSSFVTSSQNTEDLRPKLPARARVSRMRIMMSCDLVPKT